MIYQFFFLFLLFFFINPYPYCSNSFNLFYNSYSSYLLFIFVLLNAVLSNIPNFSPIILDPIPNIPGIEFIEKFLILSPINL